MAGIIKSVLREELGNSLRMKKAYEKELRKLPPGHIAIKKIRGHYYAYRVKREGRHVCFRYQGKSSQQEWNSRSKAKAMRSKYRNLLSQAKKQIRYLRGVLRGKEAI